MKKILLSSLLVGSLLFANKIAIPMSASSLAVENSGILSAIDAYQDGVGIYTVEQIGSAVIDNSEMNALVYKYGAEAKIADVNIKDYILSNGNVAEKVLAGSLGKFESITPGNGTVCNDKNAQTINDKYVNGLCIGTNIEGQSCNDSNIQTINDKYINGLCIGTNVQGQACNDNNVQTINDKYLNGVCVGTNVEGQICNDNNAQTINDKYVNGICVGTNVQGQTCNDNNAQTSNDKYNNGVCIGTITVEGTSCLDLYNKGIRTDGTYKIDVDGPSNPLAPINLSCDMVNGGWTLLPNMVNQPYFATTPSTGYISTYNKLINEASINYNYFLNLFARSENIMIEAEFVLGDNFYLKNATSQFNHANALYDSLNQIKFNRKWLNINTSKTPYISGTLIIANYSTDVSFTESKYIGRIYSSIIKFK